MVQPISHSPDDPISNPDTVARKKFSTVRRGYDPDEVQRFLRQVAAGLSDATTREADMRARLGKAVGRAERAEQPSEKELTDRLGEEVAQVIQAARDASTERIARAAAEADHTLSEAQLAATDVRQQADLVLAERTTEAEAAADAIVAEAEEKAAAIRQAAAETLRQSQNHAVANLEAARIEGEDLIAQSEEARAQILQDMDRRRRTMRSQVELLKAGRDRLMQSHEVLRRSLDEIGTELQLSVAEAKIKGDNAERRMLEMPLSNGDQLETELADASMIGMITLPDVERVPDLDPEGLPEELRAAVMQVHDLPETIETTNEVSLPVEASHPEELQTEDASDVEELVVDEALDAEEPVVEDASDAEELSVEEAAYVQAMQDEDLLDGSGDVEVEEYDEPDWIAEDDAADDVAADGDAADDLAVDELDESETEPVQEVARTIVVPDTSRRLSVVDLGSSGDAKGAIAQPSTADPAPEPAAFEVPVVEAPAKVSAMDRLFANLRDSEDTATEDTANEDTATEDTATGEPEDGVDADRGDAALARVRDSAIADLESTIERRAKRVLADEQNALLEWLGSTDYNGVLLDGLPDEDAHVASYLDAIRPQLEASFGAGAAFVGSQAIDTNDAFEDARQIITDRIVGPIRDRFASVGEDVDAAEATTIVSGFYRGHKTGDFAAHTSWIALLTFSRGTLAAITDGDAVRWAFHEGEGGCPDGYDNSFGGAVPAGEPFPSGHIVAPLGVNCRCLLVPAEG